MRDALEAGKLLVVMRAAEKWTRAILKLAGAITNRNRAPYVSPGDLGKRNFDRIVAALRG